MKINENNTLVFALSKKEVDFSFTDSPFSEQHCFDYDNQCFEDLRDAPSELEFKHEFRVVLSDDDYDYVEDQQLIEALRAARA